MAAMVEIKLLQRYRVDRTPGATPQGAEELVVLVLKSNDGPEMAYAISKLDAMVIALRLTEAAQDALRDTRD